MKQVENRELVMSITKQAGRCVTRPKCVGAAVGSPFANFLSLVLVLVLGTFIGLAIGYFLDRAFGSKPWLTLLFLGFGVAAGFTNLFRVMRRQQKG